MIDRRVREHVRTVTDHSTFANHGVATNPSTGADLGMRFNHGATVHASGRIHLSRFSDDGTRMDARDKLLRLLFDDLQSIGKPCIRIFNDDHRTRSFITVNLFLVARTQNDHTGLTILHLMDELRIGQESDFVRLSFRERSNVIDHHALIRTDQFTDQTALALCRNSLTQQFNGECLHLHGLTSSSLLKP